VSVRSPGRATPGAGLASAGRRLVALARSTPLSLLVLRPRRPRVRVRTGPAVPAWALRLLLAGLAVGCVVLAGAGPVLAVAGVAAALVLALRPGGVAPAAVVGYVAVVLLGSGHGGGPATTAALLLGTHLLVQLAALLGRTSWWARVELRALAAPVPRFLAVQAAAQLLALLGAAVTTGGLRLPWLAAAAAVGLGALLLGLVPRLGSPPAPVEPPDPQPEERGR